MTWIKYNSLQDVPVSLWQKIGANNPCLSYEFMTIVESLHPKDKFCYAILYDGDNIEGIAFYYIFNALPSVFKFIPFGKVLMTGTFETYGRHYWFNENLINEQAFLEQVWSLIKNEKVLAYIIRDYVTNKFTLKPYFDDNGFVHIKPYAVSLIEIPENCSKLDDYLHLSLTKKHRNTYKRLLRERSIQKTSFCLEYDFNTDIERLYRLYLNVNKKAKEFKSSPISQQFFISLKRFFGKNCFCIVMKNSSNNIVGFVLVIQNNFTMIPFLMGIDYNYRSLHIWHNLTLECIRHAIDNKIKEIDLGLTNYELKKRLGAKKYDINMLARFRNNTINKYFNFSLSKLI